MLKTSILKTVALFIFTFLCNYCLAQPGYDYQKGKIEIEILTKKIVLYPDSISLHEARFKLLSLDYSFEDALTEINYLLSKEPKSKDYLLQKAYLYQRSYFINKGGIEQIIPYFEDYFREEKNIFFIRKELVSLGRSFFYEKKYNIALEYYDRALAVKDNKRAYHGDNDIKNYKVELFDGSKQYDKALDLIEEIDGKLSLRAIRYNNLNIKDYNLAKKNIIEALKQSDKQNIQNQFNYTSPDGKFEKYIGRHILELAYTEYKLKNTKKALEILYNYALFDFKNLFISMGEVYEPYWCMYVDLYKQYEQKDYRIHVITAYNYTNETHGLTSMKFDDKTMCKPAILLNLKFNSHNDFALKLNQEALNEIEIAEKLSSKKFNLFRAVIFNEMDNQTQAFEIINPIIQKYPQNAEAYLVRAHINLNGNKDNFKAYKIDLNKAKELGIGKSLFTIKNIH